MIHSRPARPGPRRRARLRPGMMPSCMR